ncbi:hypothetical protein Glove_81g26 [Diversispora epigaea]|uniref:Uncharacterized protein n=1 Tax=Diversispora epigaea TaxID=1348612 RepID=A0A397JGZ6_9GLOM|nr:hypothetical protein Glove_81g26 [Diversispora epigaea]
MVDSSKYFVIQAINRIALSFILTFRTHQIYESIHPRKNNRFVGLIVSVFLKRKVVGLTTICLIVQLAFEGPLLVAIFNAADCHRMSECRTKIDENYNRYGLSNTAPSCAGIALAIIALSGIVVRLENRYQLRIDDQQSLIRFSQGWNLGGIVMISYFITYEIYFTNEREVFYLNLKSRDGPLLVAIFNAADCHRMSECRTKIDENYNRYGLSNTAPSCAGIALAIIALSGIVVRLENRYQLRIDDQQSLIRFSQGWNLGGIVMISYFITYEIYFTNEREVFYLNLKSRDLIIYRLGITRIQNQKALDAFWRDQIFGRYFRRYSTASNNALANEADRTSVLGLFEASLKDDA